ncbi:myoD family inhibitor [Megalops cyprinoides]|uniref:myoD family inhibitor n=1 Tax=Megalops cyprinoides TaxID=118141 RepID=UPI00186559E9|nr:myoD family inhibitor [Megalops cyprinoides]
MSEDGNPGTSLNDPPNEARSVPQNSPPTPCSEADRSDEPQGPMGKSKPAETHRVLENGNNNNSLSQLDFSTQSPSITCQPQARSTPLIPAADSSSDTAGLLRNGVRPHPPEQNGVKNGAPRDRAPAAPLPRSASQRSPRKLQSNPSITSQSSKKSKSSSKSAGSQIPTEAQDDCCVHCILACLFCEFLTLCNIVLDCATCGSCASDDSCFCCCCASEECGDCDLPCDMDCGIIDACCESADCLEICMECCGLCFSS